MSYGEYLKAPGQRVSWLRTDRLLGERHIPKDSPDGRKEFARQVEERRAWETQADHRQIRRGWCPGDDEFRKELLAVGKSAGASHYGSEGQERDEAKAGRLVDEHLKRMGWTEKELAQRPKGAKEKVEIARMLRQQTTMTLKWIAHRLHMGAWTYVSNLLTPNQPKNVNSED